MMPGYSSFILLPSSFQQIFDGQHRPPGNLLFAALDLLPQRGVVGDLDRLPEREVLVVGEQNGHFAIVAGEDGSPAGDLAVADEVARLLGEVDDLDAPVHYSFTIERGPRRGAGVCCDPSSNRPARYARNSSPTAGCLSA